MSQRLLTNELLTLSRRELETYWSIDDVVEQHQVLDELEAANTRIERRRAEEANRG